MKHAGPHAFTLWACKDMTSAIRKDAAELRGAFGPNTAFLPYCGDIKNMYTSLPHDMVIRAIEFVLDRCARTRQGRTRHVSFERKHRGRIQFGRSRSNSEMGCMSFKDILRVSSFDIRHAFFKSLGTVLRQVVGIPMGSPGSPSYAICICMYYEHQFHQSLHDHKRLVRGKRYIDDLFALVAFDKTDRSSYDRARAIIARLEHAYHPDMKLKPEDTTKEFAFLQGLLTVHGTGVTIRHHAKNFSRAREGKPRLLTTKHRRTFMTSRMAINTVLGALHRLAQTTVEDELFLPDIYRLLWGMHTIGYTTRDFHKALRRIAKTLPDEKWANALRHVRAHELLFNYTPQSVHRFLRYTSAS